MAQPQRSLPAVHWQHPRRPAGDPSRTLRMISSKLAQCRLATRRRALCRLATRRRALQSRRPFSVLKFIAKRISYGRISESGRYLDCGGPYCCVASAAPCARAFGPSAPPSLHSPAPPPATKKNQIRDLVTSSHNRLSTGMDLTYVNSTPVDRRL